MRAADELGYQGVFEKGACKYGFDYVEMDGRPFNDAVAEVVGLLLG